MECRQSYIYQSFLLQALVLTPRSRCPIVSSRPLATQALHNSSRRQPLQQLQERSQLPMPQSQLLQVSLGHSQEDECFHVFPDQVTYSRCGSPGDGKRALPSAADDGKQAPSTAADDSTLAPPSAADDGNRAPSRAAHDSMRAPPNAVDDGKREPPRADNGKRAPPGAADDGKRAPPSAADDGKRAPPRSADNGKRTPLVTADGSARYLTTDNLRSPEGMNAGRPHLRQGSISQRRMMKTNDSDASLSTSEDVTSIPSNGSSDTDIAMRTVSSTYSSNRKRSVRRKNKVEANVLDGVRPRCHGKRPTSSIGATETENSTMIHRGHEFDVLRGSVVDTSSPGEHLMLSSGTDASRHTDTHLDPNLKDNCSGRQSRISRRNMSSITKAVHRSLSRHLSRTRSRTTRHAKSASLDDPADSNFSSLSISYSQSNSAEELSSSSNLSSSRDITLESIMASPMPANLSSKSLSPFSNDSSPGIRGPSRGLLYSSSTSEALGSFFRHLSSSSLAQIAKRLKTYNNEEVSVTTTPTANYKLLSPIVSPYEELFTSLTIPMSPIKEMDQSLSQVFREYLESRSIVTDVSSEGEDINRSRGITSHPATPVTLRSPVSGGALAQDTSLSRSAPALDNTEYLQMSFTSYRDPGLYNVSPVTIGGGRCASFDAIDTALSLPVLRSGLRAESLGSPNTSPSVPHHPIEIFENNFTDSLLHCLDGRSPMSDSSGAVAIDGTDDLGSSDAVAIDGTDDRGSSDAVAIDGTDDLGSSGAVAIDRTDDFSSSDAVAIDRTDDLSSSDAVAIDRTDDLSSSDAVAIDRTDDLNSSDAAAIDRTDDLSSYVTATEDLDDSRIISQEQQLFNRHSTHASSNDSVNSSTNEDYRAQSATARNYSKPFQTTSLPDITQTLLPISSNNVTDNNKENYAPYTLMPKHRSSIIAREPLQEIFTEENVLRQSHDDEGLGRYVAVTLGKDVIATSGAGSTSVFHEVVPVKGVGSSLASCSPSGRSHSVLGTRQGTPKRAGGVTLSFPSDVSPGSSSDEASRQNRAPPYHFETSL